MSSRLPTALSSFAAFAAIAAAQAPSSAPEPGSRNARTGVTTYSESVSRDLFSACDSDSDDRLDVFEAGDSLDAVRDAKDAAGFERLDTDRDGFVSWPEFDRHFWAIVQRGGAFHVRPCRSLAEPSPERQEARPASPLQVFLRLHDKNGNGGLDPDELEQMVRTTNLPPSLGSELRKLDQDMSGRVDEAELAPAFELLRPFVTGTPGAPAAASGALPPPWQAADTDGNGRIDQEEFASVLRRLDPTLARWAQVLLRALDKNGDGSLVGSELPQPERPVRHGTANNHRRAPTLLPSGTLTQAASDAPLLPAGDR